MDWSTKRVLLCLLLNIGLLLTGPCQLTHGNVDDSEAEVTVENDDTEVADDYTSPEPSDPSAVYFHENFDDVDTAEKKWVISRAQKEDQQGAKYEGLWSFQLPQRVLFNNDRALVLKSKAKHAAISAKLNRPFKFTTKPLLVQYEVTFQNGMDCGGAYIKLLSQSDKFELDKFTNKSPYTIMFGPDKCGNDHKLHFIFRHKNPITGEFEEKHAPKPSSRLEESYTDKKPHSYLLKLYPNNNFQIYVDGNLVSNGNLLEDMSPPVNPPAEIADTKDSKPSTWDDREKIPDLTSTKPDDWDEDLPAMIPDPNSVMPEGWLEDEEPMIDDTTAQKPDDWDDSMDGDWEPPKINNPLCANAPGCGEWTPAQMPNPEFKGKWKPPMIPNPEYKGQWSPRMIPNPAYFEDKEPFKMTPIGALGIELWTMTDQLLFDNFIITDEESVLDHWISRTYDLKRRVLDKDAESVVSRIFNYTNAHPWLWAVYLVVIALPVVLILTFCCGSSQEKRDARTKKTDEYVKDDEPEVAEEKVEPQEPTEPVAAHSSSSRSSRTDPDKEKLELDDGAMGDVQGESEESDEDSDFNEATTESENEGPAVRKGSPPKRRTQRAD